MIRFIIHGNGYHAIAADVESVVRCVTTCLSPKGRTLAKAKAVKLAKVRDWAAGVTGNSSICEKSYTVIAAVVPDEQRDRSPRRMPLPPVKQVRTDRRTFGRRDARRIRYGHFR